MFFFFHFLRPPFGIHFLSTSGIFTAILSGEITYFSDPFILQSDYLHFLVARGGDFPQNNGEKSVKEIPPLFLHLIKGGRV